MNRYVVIYRRKRSDDWRTIPGDMSSLQATRVRESFEEQGFEVRIEPVEAGHPVPAKPTAGRFEGLDRALIKLHQPHEARVAARAAGAGR